MATSTTNMENKMTFIQYIAEIFNENSTNELIYIIPLDKKEIHDIRQELKEDDETAFKAAKKVGEMLTRQMMEELCFPLKEINAYIKARNLAGVQIILE